MKMAMAKRKAQADVEKAGKRQQRDAIMANWKSGAIEADEAQRQLAEIG